MSKYWMKLVFNVCLVISFLILSGCTSESNSNLEIEKDEEQHSSVEWADVVMWKDKKYYFDEEKTVLVSEEDIDLELGEIKFTVIRSKEKNNPKYMLKNNEATLLKEQSILYSIKGEESSKYIYSDGKVYRAD